MPMKLRLRFILIIGLIFFNKNIIAQQTIQLFQEDFNAGNNTFTLNSGGPSSASGANKWIVNNDFNGNGIYPNTTQQNNTFSGTIAGAPTSTYLHIHDELELGTSDCNYDNGMMSDNFAYMSGSFCTVGLTDIKFTFFYLAEGTATDFGRVYYSLDGGGSWVQCGALQYNNETLWKYEIITDPAFENQPDVRFGFRWTNAANGGTDKMSFGVDDIIAVGTYDTNNPVTITCTASPNPVCEGASVILNINLSSPLCAGSYSIQLSDANGNFGNPQLWSINLGTGQTSTAVQLTMPNALGGCYTFRVNRVEPPPAITGEVSVCIQVIDCPNTITTLQPVVTYGPDTTCINSVIDVPFFSTGAFNNNNTYIAQLSDANGSFANPQVLGTFPSSASFDPLLGSPPGTVSGLIPITPPGCNYYIRVISTSPAVTPSPADYFGPFCLRECDIQTNNMQDISVCITPDVGVDTTLVVEINSFGNNVPYGVGNQFEVQIINSMTYQVINTGTLGTVIASTNTTLTLSIPGLTNLIAILGAPGTGLYYMRIVPTNANSPSDTLGTLVRLIIGSPFPLPLNLIPDDTLICAGDLLLLYFNPQNPQSTYQWYSPILNNNQPFYWAYNPLSVQFNPATAAGAYTFTIRENNFGCFNPWSDTVSVQVNTVPNVNISSPSPICVGDTIKLQVQYQPGTYYEWDATVGDILDTSNNIIKMLYDTVGLFQVNVFALNECGSNQNTKNVNVRARPDVVAGNDVILCEGLGATLSAVSSLAASFSWTLFDSTQVGTQSNLTLVPDSTTDYIITTTSAQGCKDRDTVRVIVNPNPEIYIDKNVITCFGADDASLLASANALLPFTYLWSYNGATNSGISNLAAGTYSITLTDANGCSASTSEDILNPQQIQLTLTTTPVTYGNIDATVTAIANGGTEPYSYVWNTVPSQSTETITGLDIGTFTVTVTDANGCSTLDSITTTYAENNIYVPNVFSPNGDGDNDKFDFYAINLASVEVAVYNRWGQRVWYSTSLKRRWDGIFNNRPVDLGVYVYVINATFLDGSIATKKGNVTVIR
jgi:gliding motility-associated-like protein